MQRGMWGCCDSRRGAMATRRAFGGLPQECVLWAGFAQPGVCSVCSSAVPSSDLGDSSSPASPRPHAGFGHQWALLVALRDGQRQPPPTLREKRKRGQSGAPASSVTYPVFNFPYSKPVTFHLLLEVSRPQCCHLLQCLCRDGECAASASRAEDGERGRDLPAAGVTSLAVLGPSHVFTSLILYVNCTITFNSYF